MQIDRAPASPPPLAGPRPDQTQLLAKAQAFEAAFLSQMLGLAGMGANGAEGGAFSGGAGERQFASFLRDEQAALMVKRGGIGLSEQLFRSMGGVAE